MREQTFLAALAIVLAMGFLPVAEAQRDGAVSRLSLGRTTAIPGSSVVVPIHFEPGAGAKVRELLITVSYRSSGFTFEKLDQSPAAREQALQLSLEDYTTAGQGRAETSTLNLRASRREEQDSEGLPAGMLGALNFRVHGNHEGGPVDLKVAVEATEAVSGRPIPEASFRIANGEVWVQAPTATPGCFFFTH